MPCLEPRRVAGRGAASSPSPRITALVMEWLVIPSLKHSSLTGQSTWWSGKTNTTFLSNVCIFISRNWNIFPQIAGEQEVGKYAYCISCLLVLLSFILLREKINQLYVWVKISINWSKKKPFQFKSKTHSMFYIPQSMPRLHLNFRAKLSMQTNYKRIWICFYFHFLHYRFFPS